MTVSEACFEPFSVPRLNMPALRQVILAGTALAVTGGVAYAAWSLFNTTRREEPERSSSEQEKDEELVEVNREPVRQTPNPSQQGQESGSQVLVLGLDGAGKTSLLHCFVTGGSVGQDISPTKGFNAVSINRDDLQIEFLEIGGEEKLRDYWPVYLKNARVMVFVVDAADPSRFPLAKTYLHRLLAPEPHLPLILLANKQDLPGACGVSELFESMALESVGDARKLYILGTQAQKGPSGSNAHAQEAYELIVEMMTSSHAE